MELRSKSELSEGVDQDSISGARPRSVVCSLLVTV